MLKELKQNVWELADRDSVICILTNDALFYNKDIISNQILVSNPMGGGIAWECLSRNNLAEHLVAANMMWSHTRLFDRDLETNAWLFRFSTMYSPGQEANLDLIKRSLIDLKGVCEEFPNKKIYLPRPGCGIGGLDWETQVKPLVEKYLGNFENIYIVSK